MNAEEWKQLIIEHTKRLDLYQDAFLPSIEAAALVCAERDAAYQSYTDSGEGPVVEHVSDRGSVNLKRNERLRAWMDLDRQALDHWKSLGLTIDSLKKINESAMAKKQGSSLVEALKAFGNDEKGSTELENGNRIRKSRTKRKKDRLHGAEAGSGAVLP